MLPEEPQSPGSRSDGFRTILMLGLLVAVAVFALGVVRKWNSDSWAGVTALATILTGFVVAYYTQETQRLREVSGEQLRVAREELAIAKSAAAGEREEARARFGLAQYALRRRLESWLYDEWSTRPLSEVMWGWLFSSMKAGKIEEEHAAVEASVAEMVAVSRFLSSDERVQLALVVKQAFVVRANIVAISRDPSLHLLLLGHTSAPPVPGGLQKYLDAICGGVGLAIDFLGGELATIRDKLSEI